MTTALSTTSALGWDEMLKQVRAARAAGIVPAEVKSDEAGVAIMLKAAELGIPPMAAFSQIHVIKGKPSLSSQLMLAKAYELLPKFGFKIVKSDDDVATISMRRSPDHEWVELTFTQEQAKKAGLGGATYQKWGADMLRWRVVSKLLRLVAPDKFAGTYTPEELQEMPDEPGAPIPTEVRILEAEQPEATEGDALVLVERMDASESLPELHSVGETVNTLKAPPERMDFLRDNYKRNLGRLKNE